MRVGELTRLTETAILCSKTHTLRSKLPQVMLLISMLWLRGDRHSRPFRPGSVLGKSRHVRSGGQGFQMQESMSAAEVRVGEIG